MDNTNKTDTPFIPIQQSEPLIQTNAQITEKSPIKKVAIITIVVGLVACGYNLILAQAPKPTFDYLYYIEGIALIATGLVLLLNQKYSKIIFSIITWLSRPYLLFMLLIISIINLLNPRPIIASQEVLVISLLIYIHSTKSIICKYVKLNKAAGQVTKVTIKYSKLSHYISYASLLLIFISIIALSCSIYGLIIDPSYGKTKEYESYLENKYNEKFEVFDFKTTAGSVTETFTSYDRLTAKAYPINNRGMTFEVSSDIRNYTNDCSDYTDDYTSKVWESEEKPKIEKKLKEVYGTVPKYEISIVPNDDPRVIIPNGAVQSFDKAIASNYKPYLHLTTYIVGTGEYDIDTWEVQFRTMSNYIANELGFTDFSFDYIIRSEVSSTHLVCEEQLASSNTNYQDINTDFYLGEYYTKKCN